MTPFGIFLWKPFKSTTIKVAGYIIKVRKDITLYPAAKPRLASKTEYLNVSRNKDGETIMKSFGVKFTVGPKTAADVVKFLVSVEANNGDSVDPVIVVEVPATADKTDELVFPENARIKVWVQDVDDAGNVSAAGPVGTFVMNDDVAPAAPEGAPTMTDKRQIDSP